MTMRTEKDDEVGGTATGAANGADPTASAAPIANGGGLVPPVRRIPFAFSGRPHHRQILSPPPSDEAKNNPQESTTTNMEEPNVSVTMSKEAGVSLAAKRDDPVMPTDINMDEPNAFVTMSREAGVSREAMRDAALVLLYGGGGGAGARIPQASTRATTSPVAPPSFDPAAPPPLAYLVAKKSVSGAVWAGLVHLNVPRKQDGEPRALNTTCVRGVSIVEWDLEGWARTEACTQCVALGRPCEYTSVARPHVKCRECLIRQKGCFVAKKEKEKEKDTDTAKLPKEIRHLFASGLGPDTAQLRAHLLRLPLAVQRAVRAELPPPLWIDLVNLGLPRTARDTDCGVEAWDLAGEVRRVPCGACVSRMTACEVGAEDQACRRCVLALPRSACAAFAPPDNTAKVDHDMYLNFVAAHNDKAMKAKDKGMWLRTMRDIVVKMGAAKQAEVRARIGDERWAQVVHVGLRTDGAGRVKRMKERRAKEPGDDAEQDVLLWDLVPVRMLPECTPCKAGGVVCEYTCVLGVGRPIAAAPTTHDGEPVRGRCRECVLEGRECRVHDVLPPLPNPPTRQPTPQRAPADDSDPDDGEHEVEENDEPPENFDALLAELRAASRATKTLRAAVVSLSDADRAKAKSAATDPLWEGLVKMGLPPDIYGRANGAGGAAMKIGDWDVLAVGYRDECTFCTALDLPCERVRADQAGSCRRCRLKRRGCTAKDLPPDGAPAPSPPKRQPGKRKLEPDDAGPSKKPKIKPKTGDQDAAHRLAPSLSHVAGGNVKLKVPGRALNGHRPGPLPSVSAPLPPPPPLTSVNGSGPPFSAPLQIDADVISASTRSLLDRLEKELERKDREIERQAAELARVRAEAERGGGVWELIRGLEREVKELREGAHTLTR